MPDIANPPDRGALSGPLAGISFIVGVAGAMALADLPYPHAVGFGVLVGALGPAGLRTDELPRPLAVAGLASAAASLLSPLYFVAEPAGWLIPVGRFSGLLVSGIAGVQLASGPPAGEDAMAADGTS